MPVNVLGKDNSGFVNFSLPFPEATTGGTIVALSAGSNKTIPIPATAIGVYMEMPAGVCQYGIIAPTAPSSSAAASQCYVEGGVRNFPAGTANLYLLAYTNCLCNMVWLYPGNQLA